MYMSFRVIGETYTSTLGVSLIDELFTVLYIHACLFLSFCMNLNILDCCFGYHELLLWIS
ncbi:hypothetical protein Syun_004478 [Stephania yunnanensis]|uniref:Uncharacterized protein n=1 Tax=Stephania yunnanensis TaxID=152371 RepID=A0AAP0L3K0_9MAGN